MILGVNGVLFARQGSIDTDCLPWRKSLHLDFIVFATIASSSANMALEIMDKLHG
jgi:hypothetical protein